MFENLFIKEQIEELSLQEEIKIIARNFKTTTVYEELHLGAQHLFEYSFDEVIDGQAVIGSIDLIYKDKQK